MYTEIQVLIITKTFLRSEFSLLQEAKKCEGNYCTRSKGYKLTKYNVIVDN